MSTQHRIEPGALVDEETFAAIAAVKAGIVQGHRTRDRSALDDLYAEDFTASTAAGVVRSKSDLLAGLGGSPEMIEGEYVLTFVRRWGDVAVASRHGRMVYREPDESSHVSEYDSTNVFALRDGRWKYVAAYLP